MELLLKCDRTLPTARPQSNYYCCDSILEGSNRSGVGESVGEKRGTERKKKVAAVGSFSTRCCSRACVSLDFLMIVVLSLVTHRVIALGWCGVCTRRGLNRPGPVWREGREMCWVGCVAMGVWVGGRGRRRRYTPYS